MRKAVAMVFGVLLIASTAAAQSYKPLDVNLGFGGIFPTADFKNDFNAGWNGTIGATFNLNERFGIQADYTYGRMNGPDKTITVFPTPSAANGSPAVIQSNHQMHVGTFDAIYKVHKPDAMVGGYVIGGLGVYHRIVQLTTPAVGYATVCDPYWYVCYPAAVAVDQIIGERASNDFGINIGGGLTFGPEGKLYIESRYHYVWGKTVTPAVSTAACSNGCTTNAAYFPLTVGFRF